MRSGDLPEHVRSLVAEIETEIGDADDDLLASYGPAGAHDAGGPEAPKGSAGGIPMDALAPAAAIEGAAGRSNGNDRVEGAVREILREIGEDPDRAGLLGTPGRVHRMYAELTAGYHVDPARLMNGAIFDVAYSEMVVVRDIPFYSLCEHHLLPFFGTAAVAYIPNGRVIGLSKIPRIVEMYARRLQVQERLTSQIADFLMANLHPQGVGIVIEATHLCAVMRGVRKPGTVMTTSHVLGLFRSNDKTRGEFLAHLARQAPGA